MPRLLTSIKLDDGGFYRNWSSGENLKKRTVVFGRNGSGKSTLVRHFRGADQPGSPITAETDLDILFFNEDYVRENLCAVFTGSGLSSACSSPASQTPRSRLSSGRRQCEGHGLTAWHPSVENTSLTPGSDEVGARYGP